MINKFRKSIKRMFFKGPYKVRSIPSILTDKYSKGIHEPEGQLQVIKEEAGDSYWYKAPKFLYNDAVDEVLLKGRKRYLHAGLFTEPVRRVFSIHHAGTLGNAGVVYLPDSRTVIKETAVGYETSAKDHSVLTAIRTASPEYLNGVSLSMVKMASEGYYHFLHEALPKLLFCKNLINRVDNLIVSGMENQALVAWLKEAGVSPDKLRYTNGLTNYRYEQLLFTTDLVCDMQPSPWSTGLLRKTFLKVGDKKPWRWIWASRNDSVSRNISWEEDIIKAFPKFEKVIFSELTPKKVVELMSECALFCGPHGAAFSNIVFQQEGSTVIEFYPQNGHFFRPVYSRLADVCHLQHLYIKQDFLLNQDVLRKLEDALELLNVE